MSNPYLARRTRVEAAFSGVNITDSIQPYLLSMTYTDNEEDAADDLQIKLQDRDELWMESWLKDVIEAAAFLPSTSLESGLTSYKVTAVSGLNVRTGPGTGYKRLGTLACGAAVQASAIENGWAVIQYSGQTAYAYAGYLQVIGSASGGNFAVGDTVRFTGSQHYVSSSGDKGYPAKPGPAEITLHNPGSKHPWHLIHTDGTSNIYGWVNEGDIQSMDESHVSSSAGSETGFKMQAAIVQENWIGDGKNAVLDSGEFELDSVAASGPPAVITIKGTSLPFTAQIRQTKKSKAWESFYLSCIANEIAAANGMVCMYESASDPFYSRVEQLKTSDIQFLETLCHNEGISLKVTNRILVLFDQAAYESKAAIFTIKRGGGAYKKYKLNVGTADTQYSSCRVSYVDSTGKCIEGVAKVEDYKADAKNNQQLEITAKVADKDEATALAEKMLRKHNRYAKTATFTMRGNPNLVAGITVMLEGWGGWDGKYIVTQAKHTVDGSGYTVQIKLRRVLEGY